MAKKLEGWKLFEKDRFGNLHPLFIDAKEILEIGVVYEAKFSPTKGFAERGGWHIGMDVPDAPWLKGYDGTDCGCYKSRYKGGKRVWCKVRFNATHDYNEEVQKLKGKCFADKCPEDGYYFFREAGKGVWAITSHIEIIREINEIERKRIMLEKGYDEIEAYKKYKTAFEKRMKTA